MILGAAAALMLCVIAIFAFNQPPPNERTCSPALVQLLVEEDTLRGGGWRITAEPENEGMYQSYGVLSECAVFYTSPTGSVFEYVLEFNSRMSAMSAFRQLREAEYRGDTAGGGGWETPLTLPTSVLRADEERVACSHQGERRVCRAIGRYGACVVLITHVSERPETPGVPEDIFVALASQVEEVLSAANQDPCLRSDRD